MWNGGAFCGAVKVSKFKCRAINWPNVNYIPLIGAIPRASV